MSAPCKTVWLNSITRFVSPKKFEILSFIICRVSTEFIPIRILGFFTNVSLKRSRKSFE